MRPGLSVGAAGLLAAIVLTFAACNKQGGDAGAPEENLQQFELHEIGGLYDVYLKEKQRPPSSVKDLKQYDVGFPNGFEALQAGRCVAVWGLDPATLPDRAHTVLAYQAQTPTQDGYVLLADLNIKKMSADEFKALTKTTP